MKPDYLFLLLLSLTGHLSAQNLIRNFDFEELECPDNPINSVFETPTWYAIGADAYWVHLNCPYDPVATASIVALKPNQLAYTGIGYIALEGLLFRNGYYLTEGMGIELTEPLKAGKPYYFDMATMHYDLVESPDFPDGGCDPLPERFMEVGFSDERISITVEDTMIGLSSIILSSLSVNADRKLIDRSPEEANFKNNKWNPFWDCFLADGTERHLAVMGNNYQITGENACLEPYESGAVYYFGHALDAVRLYEIPTEIDTSLNMCPSGIGIDLRDVVEGPFFDKASFLWQDGYTQTTRQILSPGVYNIDMILPCITVPITLDIEEIPCEADIYVPNAFSPNDDGINDVLQPYIKAFWPINYFHFKVFDRWGSLVFQSKNMQEGWDGKITNSPAPGGVYLWSIEYELDDGKGERKVTGGDVLIVR